MTALFAPRGASPTVTHRIALGGSFPMSSKSLRIPTCSLLILVAVGCGSSSEPENESHDVTSNDPPKKDGDDTRSQRGPNGSHETTTPGKPLDLSAESEMFPGFSYATGLQPS